MQFVPGPLLGGVTKLGTSEFLSSLKRFIARWGRPAVIYSDNGRTSVGAAQWLKQVRGDENLQAYLAHQNIKWKFNVSRAPLWGGQFERLIGIVINALYKTVGNTVLTWKELSEVVLDIAIALNNRPPVLCRGGYSAARAYTQLIPLH